MKKDYCLIENKSELGAGTRGSSLAVDAIRSAALVKGSNFFHDLKTKSIVQNNAALTLPGGHSHAKKIDVIREIYQDLCYRVFETLRIDQQTPIVISGDHSSAGGTLAGIKKAYPDAKIGVVWIDAHADMHSPYTTPSGNVHGMPLAAAMGMDNLDNQINEPDAQIVRDWEALKLTGGYSPKINPENLVLMGVRDTESAEDCLIKDHGIRNVTVSEYRKRGNASVIQSIFAEELADCDKVYISFDVDSLDCDEISYGTGTPVKGGFLVDEVVEIIKGVFSSGKVCCFEMVEVNPLLDNKGNKMAEVALEVLENALPQQTRQNEISYS
ncbi:arginase [Reichenbachiella ulvae]|uniref:Arginase n=1 Tax=Reichenbachiella ulvae TaxID=2980104 RepID=A0ABT3CNH6_9BACT|nr:arginase [Reichenbachiella ulvae]MCV9385295.1 arginase [Reichenbachiella ulvae]